MSGLDNGQASKYLTPSLFWADSAHLNLNTITSMDGIAFNEKNEMKDKCGNSKKKNN